MKKILFIIFNILFVFSTINQRFMTFDQLCHHYNYPVENHTITTKDGYLLKYFRLQAKGQKIQNQKPVIYLQHGLVDSSDTWILNSQQKAPAYMFANAGYDVWVGNSRGNKYSTGHLSNIKSEQYWEFSYDQMALYDLPAAFTYISKLTKQKINYVGHSQGTIIMFAALAAEVPQVLQNIKSYMALGPAVYITNQRSNIINIISHTYMSQILELGKVNPLFTLDFHSQVLISQACYLDRNICKQGIKLISDAQPDLLNSKRLPIIMAHFPAGSSAKNFLHFKQMSKVPQFRRFDYNNEKKNIEHYGQSKPPLYDLSKIRLPVHIFAGELDKLADVQDAQRTFDELTNSLDKSITYLNLGHAGFIWNDDMSFYKKIMEKIEQYN